ncbi:hypothetical protein V6N12_054350 [Hibiscus sabdariffa]|uniref:Uncharacterized protein n=1 Tax=Hibiscus sabdariffa TaxID=183260 RepID=A0ABR2D054_9ROSI
MHIVVEHPASKFSPKLLVYQRRPKASIQSASKSLSTIQVDLCLHQRSSSSLPQISDGQESVHASSTQDRSGSVSCQEDASSIQDRSASVSCQEDFSLPAGFCVQGHLLPLSKEKPSSSFMSQESQVPITSFSSSSIDIL